ncbi:hypothetical protein BN2476_270030 [Paraburkholderia piptadeniae]|uniref:PAS domain-containing protein n=1 Tax=Paraburkholderia piptadeniae TaxID=1701573 RepID=A0A1N7S1J1_9BURK|nr:hypothetical protein BN2476_270030 [Paraburkholderia piptadeniae]
MIVAAQAWLQAWETSSTVVGIFASTAAGEVLSWNPACERIFGYTRQEIVNSPIGRLVTDEDESARVFVSLERAAGEGSTEFECWCQRKDGSRFWAEFVATALPELPDGPQLAIVVRDASGTRHAYDEAIDSGRAFRMLVEGVSDYAIFMLDPDGIVTSGIRVHDGSKVIARTKSWVHIFPAFIPLRTLRRAFPSAALI